MSFSVLSIVEVVYYFTLRLFFKFRRQQIVQAIPEIWISWSSTPAPEEINHCNEQSIQSDNGWTYSARVDSLV